MKLDRYRCNRVPHDRGRFVYIHIYVQGFRIVRYGRARCDHLLLGDRLGASDGDNLHFVNGRSEC